MATHFTTLDLVVLAACSLATIVAGLVVSRRSPFHDFLIIVFGTTAVLVVGLLARRGADSLASKEQSS
jgi:hypothetical protein